MNEMNKIMDTYNLVVGGIVTLLAAIFGKYWYLFAIFLLLNLFDYATGYMKARKLKKESSSVGLAGVVKKLGYWIIIATAFLTAYALTALGEDILNIDLAFLALLGWFTLACLLINEVWCCTIKVDIENSKGQYIEKDKQEATKDGSESTKIQHGI